jgi:excisionase family DNA binding protein
MKSPQFPHRPQPNREAMNEPVWLTIKDVASIISFSTRHVYRLVELGDLPAVRSGRTWRVPKRALQQWIADREGEAEQTRGYFNGTTTY